MLEKGCHCCHVVTFYIHSMVSQKKHHRLFFKRDRVWVKTRPRFKKTRSGFSQVLEDECHLLGRKHSLVGTIVGFFQGLGELLVGLDPGGQTVQRCARTNVWSVCLCQFAFVVWTEFHDVWCMIYNVWVFSFILPLVKGAGGCPIGLDAPLWTSKCLPYLEEHPPTPFTRGRMILYCKDSDF